VAAEGGFGVGQGRVEGRAGAGEGREPFRFGSR
jgi:hypothetical protein